VRLVLQLAIGDSPAFDALTLGRYVIAAATSLERLQASTIRSTDFDRASAMTSRRARAHRQLSE
jgi:hypothetical protein